MNSLREVSIDEFRSVLTDGEIRTLQVIHLAMPVGVMVFGFVVGMMVQTNSPLANIELITMLSAVHGMVAFGAYAAANFIYQSQFTDDRLQQAISKTFYYQRRRPYQQPITSEAGKCLAIMRTATIVRLAMMEMPGLFGLVVCFLAALNGVIQVNAWYWLNAITALIFVGFVGITFPNKEKLEQIFQTMITKQ